MASNQKVYVLKTYGANKYKWSPEKADKNKLQNKSQNNDNKFYCNAISGSQGQDWISTYSYVINITENGVKEKIAYVECDYVQ